jgi:hypothetical protein
LHRVLAPKAIDVCTPIAWLEANGSNLKRIILRHAQRWNLDPEFANWVEASYAFLNTLVDRIVPGYPAAEAEALQARFGMVDPLLAGSAAVLLPRAHRRKRRTSRQSQRTGLPDQGRSGGSARGWR